jgi:hypothetical protein
MTTLSPHGATTNNASDACAEKKPATFTNACRPESDSLDPADHQRLLSCAERIRLRAAGAMDWITPWCVAGLPSDVMAKARVGGLPARMK